MKTLAYILTCLLILINTTDAEARGLKDVYTSAEYEISHYYLSGGVWQLEGIDSAEFEHSDNQEYILVNAKVVIKNVATSKEKTETCLISLILANNDLHSINCF